MIREARREDLPAIRRLMEAEPGFWQRDWSDATLAKGIETAGDLALVWEDDSTIAGFVCAHDLGFRAYLSELIVAQGARGRGIGRNLVERIQTELAQRGRRILIADVWHDAEPFYRSLGWEPPDVVLLRRKLGDGVGQLRHPADGLRPRLIPALGRLTLAPEEQIAIVDAWRVPEARVYFRNVWPMYVHEVSGFDTDFYVLDETGRWRPNIVEDWISDVTPPQNLRSLRAEQDRAQPFQRAHVITRDGHPVGFVCVGMQPFKYMPADADLNIAEFFLTHASRGTGTAARVLELVLQRYPGRWHLRAIHDNTRAIRFWRKTLASIGVRDLEEGREDGDVVFRFVAGA